MRGGGRCKHFLVLTVFSFLFIFSASFAKEADAQTTYTVIPGDIIQNVINGADAYDTVIFSAGTYTDIGEIEIGEPLTLIGDTGDYRTSGALITGATRFVIIGSNVTVKGFKFHNTSAPDTNLDRSVVNLRGDLRPSQTDITVEKNEFYNTHTIGIYYYRRDQEHKASRFTIRDNKFVRIGYNDTLTRKDNQESAIWLRAVTDATITNNIIEDTTWSGMNLDNIREFTISNNYINGTSKVGIQIANAPDADTIISNNIITNANNNLTLIDTEGRRKGRYGNAARVETISGDPDNDDSAIVRFVDPSISAAINIRNSSGVAITTGNILNNNHDGIIICPGRCDIYAPHNFLNIDPDYTTSATVTGNVIHSNNMVQNVGAKQGSVDLDQYNLPEGKNFINSSPVTVDATSNYWGTEGSPQAMIFGDVIYSPWYTDEDLTTLGPDYGGGCALVDASKNSVDLFSAFALLMLIPFVVVFRRRKQLLESFKK